MTVLTLLGAGALVGAAALGGVRPSSSPGPAGPADLGGSTRQTGSLAGDAVVPLIAPPIAAPSDLADGRTLGHATAPVTLVVWSDFQCPSCAAFAEQVQPRLVKDFVEPGVLKVAYRDYAFIGQESTDAAVAARCAADQGKFWPYHDYLFWNQQAENSGAFARATLDAVGRTVGLQMASFDACLGSVAQVTAVAADSTAAQKAGVQYTPTLQIGGTLMPGAPLTDAQYGALRKVIERTLAESSALPASPSPTAP